MDKIYLKIEDYLKKNFPNRKLVLNKSLEVEKNDVWGFHSIVIAVRELGNTVEYKPFFKN